MRDRTAKSLSTLHTVLYRLSGGIVGRRLVDNDMLLLTTRGRKSGQPHTVPLLYLRDGKDLVVIASWGGRPDHPDWYVNLQTHREAAVQVAGSRFRVRAETMGPEERAVWWPRIVKAYGTYATYQERTSREIPVVRLASLV